MPDDLDLAAMRAAAEAASWDDDGVLLIHQPDEALSIGILLSGEAASERRAQANTEHLLAWPPSRALALLRRLEAAEAVCEALRDWRHPEAGELPDFIAVGRALTAWMLNLPQKEPRA